MFRSLIETPAIGLPVAAAVADTTPKAVGHWLAGGLALLAAPPRTGRQAHAVYPLDVIRLAVTARLIEYGFSTVECAEILARSVDRLLEPVAPWCPDSWPVLRGRVADITIAVSREANGLAVSLSGPLGTVPAQHGAVAVTVDLFAIASEARARLARLTPHTAKE